MAVVKQDDILKYIEVEKDLSRFNIKTLERLKDISASKKRILQIEREFVSLPLEKWEFEDVAEVAAAISIYRTSRNLFYKTYGIEKPKDLSYSELEERLNKKIAFVQKAAEDFTGKKVEEMNLVQDEDLFYDLGQHLARRGRKKLQATINELETFSLKELLEVEPILLSKDRARRQATLYSLGLFFREELSKIKIEAEPSKERLHSLINEIDNIIDATELNTFKNYNVSLRMLPLEFEDGMGQNDYFKKVHRLKNVFNFDNMVRDLSDAPSLFNKNEFSFANPMIGNLLYNDKKIIGCGFSKEKRKKSKSKALGILLPIPRTGNEKMSLMYAHVCVRGKDITQIIDDCISNIKVLYEEESVYFKALMMKPLWNILDSSSNNVEYYEVLSELIGYKFEHVEEFDNKEVIKIVNNTVRDFIPLDKESIALVPKTRSEEDAFDKIKPWINKIIVELREEYYTTTNDNY